MWCVYLLPIYLFTAYFFTYLLFYKSVVKGLRMFTIFACFFSGLHVFFTVVMGLKWLFLCTTNFRDYKENGETKTETTYTYSKLFLCTTGHIANYMFYMVFKHIMFCHLTHQLLMLNEFFWCNSISLDTEWKSELINSRHFDKEIGHQNPRYSDYSALFCSKCFSVCVKLIFH